MTTARYDFVKKIWLIPVALFALAACDSLDVLGASDDAPLPGERIS
ncbi:unnamed protein product, partial [Laminaria digitata]